MNFSEQERGLGKEKRDQTGVFVTKELEGKTFYSSSEAKFKGALKPLVIKKVGYTHTTLGYAEEKETTYASGNQGKGAFIPEVVTFEEAQRIAIEFWERKKQQDATESAHAEKKINEISAATPAEMPRDPYELAKDTHTEDLTRWKEQIKKIEPLILAAKKEILRALKSDVGIYSDSKGYEVSEIIRGITGADPERAGKKLAQKVLESETNDIKIRENNMIFLKDTYFGKVEEYLTLNKYQKMALEISSILYSLEKLPLQIMETELGGRLFGDARKETVRDDKKRKVEWIEKRDKLQKLLNDFQEVDISANGTAKPPYLRVVK